MADSERGKRIFIIAGPNGAGKSTFASRFLPSEARCERFINADSIAAELSPSNPESVALAAAKLMLAEIEACTEQGISFAVLVHIFGGQSYGDPSFHRWGYTPMLLRSCLEAAGYIVKGLVHQPYTIAIDEDRVEARELYAVAMRCPATSS